MQIVKIISGGQTGADQGGLEAAIWCEVPHGGWCPKGRICENGIIPAKYHLKEMTSKDYLKRTEANVKDSDITLIFTHGRPTGGSKRTVEFAIQHGKPFAIIDSGRLEPDTLGSVRSGFFGKENTPPKVPEKCVINVAGSRESKAPGICSEVMLFMVELINTINPVIHYPPSISNPMFLRERRTGT